MCPSRIPPPPPPTPIAALLRESAAVDSDGSVLSSLLAAALVALRPGGSAEPAVDPSHVPHQSIVDEEVASESDSPSHSVADAAVATAAQAYRAHLSRVAVGQGQGSRKREILLGLMEGPLRVTAICAQTWAGMWKRNGVAMISQASTLPVPTHRTHSLPAPLHHCHLRQPLLLRPSSPRTLSLRW